jgi:transposase-like protein
LLQDRARLGVRANGERVVLDMRLVGEESAASWTEVVASLAARHATSRDRSWR